MESELGAREVRDVHDVGSVTDAEDVARDVVTLGPVRDSSAATPWVGSVVRRRVAAGAIAAALVPMALLVALPDTTHDVTAYLSPGLDPPRLDAIQPLDGRWRSAPITDTAVRRTLVDAGLGGWSVPVLSRLPERPFVSVLTIAHPWVNLDVVGSDGHTEHFDWQRRNVVADRLRLSMTRSRVATSYRWTTEQRAAGHDAVTVLDLDLEATTEQTTEGIPGEVWMRVLYTSSDFTGAGEGRGSQTQ